MTTKTLPKLTESATKADEIAFVEAVAAGLPSNSYLASLFSETFVAWIAKQIREDVCPDVIDLVRSLKESERLAVQTATDQEITIKNQQTMIETLQRDRERIKTNADQRIAAEAQRGDDILAELGRARDRATDLYDELTAARAQIAALKVKIFDMQNPALA